MKLTLFEMTLLKATFEQSIEGQRQAIAAIDDGEVKERLRASVENAVQLRRDLFKKITQDVTIFG